MSPLPGRVRTVFQARLPGGPELPPDRNFFEAGLTSVMLAGVVTELRQVGVDLSLVDLFRYPTLAALVDEIEARADAGGERLSRGLPWQT